MVGLGGGPSPCGLEVCGQAARRSKAAPAPAALARVAALASATPPLHVAPSPLGVVGRYLLSPRVFDKLATIGRGAGGEIQLTDGMKELSKTQAFHGVRFDGVTYDTGSKLGFLMANAAYALANPELSQAYRAEMKKLLG